MTFGSLDANNEYRNDKFFFQKSFLTPKNFYEDDFLSGKKNFILGPKGSGKTALLNYYKELIESKGNLCKNIFYKQDINDDIKDQFLMELDKIDLNSMDGDDISSLNFENLWQLYFHQKIIEENPTFINHDQNWKKYVREVKKIDEQHTFILENIKNITGFGVGVNNNKISNETTLSFARQQQKMKFNNLAYQIKQLFLKLRVNPNSKQKLFFLTDELELNRIHEKKFRRDSAMIRDLVIAINELNQLSNIIGRPFIWIAAIRTEVVNSIYSTGKEINKILSDNGETLNWELNGGNSSKSPIIEMLLKKILASEELTATSNKINENNYSNVDNNTLEKILNRYFTHKVNNQDTVDYIIRQTFLLPRDIVRLFNLIKDKYPEKDFFSQLMFEGVRSQYSQNTWTEISEELSAIYNPDELTGVKNILQMASQSPFSVDSFHELAEKSRDPSIKKLLQSEVKLDEVLSNLYSVNVIGNLKNSRIRFAYRGQPDFSFNDLCIVHDSIRKTLS